MENRGTRQRQLAVSVFPSRKMGDGDHQKRPAGCSRWYVGGECAGRRKARRLGLVQPSGPNVARDRGVTASNGAIPTPDSHYSGTG